MKRDQETIADDLKTSIVGEDSSYIVHLGKGGRLLRYLRKNALYFVQYF